MKVIIADDENRICQLICSLVDWKACNMEVVAVVNDGVDAWNAIHFYKPDIVITDIRMPGINGLELVEKCKNENIHTKFIIISGYGQFEYAQSAIRYGVEDYLLKPIRKRELRDVLNRLSSEYVDKMRNLSASEQQKEATTTRVRKAFLGDLLRTQSESSTEAGGDLENINAEYGFHFHPGSFLLAWVKFEGVESTNEIEYLRENSAYFLKEKVSKYCYDFESIARDAGSAYLLNYATENHPLILRAASDFLDEWKEHLTIFQHVNVTVGVGKQVASLSQLTESYKTAKWALDQRIVLGTDRVIECPQIPENMTIDWIAGLDFWDKFEISVEHMNEAEISLQLNRLYAELEQKKDLSGSGIYDLARAIMRSFRFILQKNHLIGESNQNDLDCFESSVEHCNTLDAVFCFLRQTIVGMLREFLQQKCTEDNRPIREAKKYIREHLTEPLSLQSVSDRVGFNSAYFSTLFKKETGINFSDYLTQARMEMAKQLLREADDTVALICEKVGYSDLKTFTKNFKRYTGLRPNEYRKIFG